MKYRRVTLSPNFILCSFDPYKNVPEFAKDAASPDVLILKKRNLRKNFSKEDIKPT